jgi:hypothetical protein
MLNFIRDPTTCLAIDFSEVDEFGTPDVMELFTNSFAIRPDEDEYQYLQRVCTLFLRSLINDNKVKCICRVIHLIRMYFFFLHLCCFTCLILIGKTVSNACSI